MTSHQIENWLGNRIRGGFLDARFRGRQRSIRQFLAVFDSRLIQQDDHLLWTASKTDFGYGQISFGGVPQLAHRVSYIRWIGEVPEELCVCHSCDIPNCVNPKHLFIGTQIDNAMDRHGKGRTAHQKGEASGRAKLTDSEVIAIRRLFDSGGYTQRYIAGMFGIGERQIGYIGRREQWKHI